MRELYGDLWTLARLHHPDAICILTSGFCRRNGTAVMGRGSAAKAAKYWPALPAIYGRLLASQELNTILIPRESILNPNYPKSPFAFELIAFPTKPREARSTFSNVIKQYRFKFPTGSIVPGFACMADRHLIQQSAERLMLMVNDNQWSSVYLPRPGCGNGQLHWARDVQPILAPILDDRIAIITN